MKKPFTTVTVVVLAVVAIAHALRLIFGLTVTLGGAEIPMWVSLVALLVAAAWRLRPGEKISNVVDAGAGNEPLFLLLGINSDSPLPGTAAARAQARLDGNRRACAPLWPLAFRPRQARQT
jgi:hypothetical protein